MINETNGTPVPTVAAASFFKRDWDSVLMRSVRCFGWFVAGIAFARISLACQYAPSRAAIKETIDVITILAIFIQVSALGIVAIRSWWRFRRIEQG